ncbi:MAG TPA: flagellar export chaperone FliS [Rhodanobacter sp.]
MTFGYGAGAYQQVRSHGGVESADPHGLITLLMDGALERLVKARAHMVRGEVAAKGEAISRCIEILGGLRGSLDPKADPALAGRLDSLYEYMGRRLLQANLRDDATLIDEVMKLLQPIRDSWVKIAPAPAAAPSSVQSTAIA